MPTRTWPGVGVAGEGLVVAGIGELEPVRDLGRAPGVAVAEDLPPGRDAVPEEGQQRPPALPPVGPPEGVTERGRVADAACLPADERAVRAAEDLLPPQPVSHDEHDVPGAERALPLEGSYRAGGAERRQGETQQPQATNQPVRGR